nr:hypothetical protein [Pseudomonas sp. PAMC 25886]
MKIIERVEIDAVTDVKCDVCRRSTRLEMDGLQFATLQAHWGFGTKHDGERYELHLCENCFFRTIAYIKQERRIQSLFDESEQANSEELGLVVRDDFFGDFGHR